MKLKAISTHLFLVVLLAAPLIGSKLNAEPFIKTDDLWLRADIESLANIGVIKTPINTYPLMWGPVLKDLTSVKMSDIPEAYQSTYMRLLRKGRKETGNDANYSEIRVHASQENELFRYFGDKARNKRELATRTTGMTNSFAWNLEVTLAPDSIDGDDKRFDGSYLAAIAGNWMFSVGQIEKWWGPGMQHSIILSNNAKPVPAISIQRNYSEPFETPLLSWMGPWTFNAFAGLLDDERTINNAKLLGMSYSFAPIDGLEIGLRRTAQWGGDGRPENFDSFLDMLTGLDNCDEGDLSCTGERNEPGNQLAGIDVSYRVNWSIPTSFYFQTIGEDEAGYAPSKKAWMYGANFQLSLDDNPLFINLEYIDTSVDGDGNDPGVPFDGYNVLYEHSIYRYGYRYGRRSIGSTIDNDSKMISFLLSYQVPDWGKFSLLSSNIELNIDSDDITAPGGHSIQQSQVKFAENMFKWQYQTQTFGDFVFSVISRDEDLDTNFGGFESSSLGINWTTRF
ncbi:MAG: capsule assembly Wzi family protein [Gammaproteobacteria bacterium]|nr:capsule assembly Wzi family protein [Gammaproteobacteria bacterium]